MVQLYACVNVEIHSGLGFSVFVLILVFPYSYRIVSYRTRISVLVFPYSYRTRVRISVLVSYRTRISVLGYVTYLIRSLHVLEYVIICTPYSYRIVSYSYFRTRVRHLPRSFSARTRVRHYPYSTWVQDKWVQHSLPLVYLLRFPFFFFFLMVTFSPELFTSATATLLVPVLIVA